MSPLQIKLHESSNLKIKWDNGSESIIGLKYLRDQCPCAHCKGENIMINDLHAPKKASGISEMYAIENVKVMGGYAAQIFWKDGHDKGLYTWEYLKTLSETQSGNVNHEYKPLI